MSTVRLNIWGEILWLLSAASHREGTVFVADADIGRELSAAGHRPRDLRSEPPMENAVAFVDALLESPGVQPARLGPERSKLYQLCPDRQPGSNDVPDGWLSAVVASTRERLVSFDRDFRKLLPRGPLTLFSSAWPRSP